MVKVPLEKTTPGLELVVDPYMEEEVWPPLEKQLGALLASWKMSFSIRQPAGSLMSRQR